MRQFYVDPAAVIEAACQRGAVRNMTPAEWVQFMGEQPYRATCGNLGAEE
ncbi:MAG: hypothetical protein R2911_21860 [Caldilineaceae bacterium]